MASDIVHMHPTRRTGLAWLFVLLSVVLGLSIGVSRAQTLAITFDDGFDTKDNEAQASSDNASMLHTLNHHRIRAMLFPSGLVADHARNLVLIRSWGEAGHLIGNHTYSHSSLSKSDTAQYVADVQHAHELLHKLPGWCPRLRFPYLDEGQNSAQHSQTIQWLAEHQYGVAPVTISLPDWEYAQRYLDTLKSGSDAEAASFRQNYIEQVGKQALAQAARWQEQLQRNPTHVLLLHANHLNATVLPELLQWFKSNGWTFVDPLKAFEDPIYQRSYKQTAGNTAVLPTPVCH